MDGAQIMPGSQMEKWLYMGVGIGMSTVISMGTEALLEWMSLVVKQGGSSVSVSF